MKRPAPSTSPEGGEPPAKRPHTRRSPLPTTSTAGPSTSQAPERRPASISHLSDELFLHILAFLPSPALARAQQVSQHWFRLARDNQLWKGLFLRDHSPQLLRSVSTQGRGRRRAHDPFRPLAPLPSRTARRALAPTAGTARELGEEDRDALPASGRDPERAKTVDKSERQEREEGPLDWRWIYRLSQNWATGFCRVSSLALSPRPSQPAEAPSFVNAPHVMAPLVGAGGGKVLPFAPSRLQLLGPYIILASARLSAVQILLPSSSSTSSTPQLLGGVELFTGADAQGPPTCLAVDQQPTAERKVRFAAFSPRGSIAVYSLPLTPIPHPPSSSTPLPLSCASPTSGNQLGARRTHVYTPPGGVGRPIKAAVWKGELLITLSSNFTLHVFYVPPPPLASDAGTEEAEAVESAEEDMAPTPLQSVHTLYSWSSFPPAALSLSFPSSPKPTIVHPQASSQQPPAPHMTQTAKLTLHHLLPAYPEHWVPSAHQFTITLPPTSPTSATSAAATSKTAIDIRPSHSWTIAGWLPSQLPSSSSDAEEDPSTLGIPSATKRGRVRKLRSVGAVAGDSRSLLLAGDSSLQLYRLRPSSPHLRPSATFDLPFSASDPSVGGGVGRVCAMALEEEGGVRCVLAMEGGGLAVYDLDAPGRGGVELPLPPLPPAAGSEVDGKELAGSAEDLEGSEGRESEGWVREVRFDESRVVGLWRTAGGGGEGWAEWGEERVVVWDFDC